ncbi:MAG: thioredoxin family protein [Phycisphaerales bacterium JB040]
MLSPEYLKSKFDGALPYDDYVATGKPNHREAWEAVHGRVTLTQTQRAMLAGMTRQLYALVVSGTWCGDCSQQLPILKHAEDASGGRLAVRYVDRDEHMDLAERLQICEGTRVPVCLLLNEDFDFLAFVGDRVLARYRAMAERQLGASCPLPGAPVPDDELSATTADWIDEIERAQLICRLSTKLRARHGD